MNDLEKDHKELNKSLRELNQAEREVNQAEYKMKNAEILEHIESLPETPRAVVKSMAAGALVGSVVPVIGTGIGAIIGGVAGLAWKLKK